MASFSGPRSKRLKGEDDGDVSQRCLIVVLENCSLESAKVGKTYEILSSDKHAGFLRKQKKDPSAYRPDILHQCLLMLMDSPLNRSGLLRVFVHTQKNVLIEISPQTRIPRTFDRFCGLMTQLLHKLSIRAAESSQKLLKVIKCPVSAHLPIGCRKYLTSFNAKELIDCRDVVPREENLPVVVVIGGMATGKVSTDYTDEEIKISSFPLSAALTCAKVTCAFEEVWGIRDTVCSSLTENDSLQVKGDSLTGYFVRKELKISYVDYALFEELDIVIILDPNAPKMFLTLIGFHQRMANRPLLKVYIAKRRQMRFPVNGKE